MWSKSNVAPLHPWGAHCQTDYLNSCTSLANLLVASQHGLSPHQWENLNKAIITSIPTTSISLIFSMRQMHVYFRVGHEIFDYRPHLGRFSTLHQSHFRPAITDRVELILPLTTSELENFHRYIKAIRLSRSRVLGATHALRLTEPNFTVLDHKTHQKIDNNQFINSDSIHNCLTWFTLAPIGLNGESICEQEKFTLSDYQAEMHSYICAFYSYWATNTSSHREPSFLLATKIPLDEARHLATTTKLIQEYYSPNPRVNHAPSHS